MGRWHRRPKRVNLKPLVRDSDCTIVLGISFDQEFLETIRHACRGVVSEARIVSARENPERANSILVLLAPDNHDSELNLSDGWRGFVLVSRDRSERSIVEFLTVRARYVLANRYCKLQSSAPPVCRSNGWPPGIHFFPAADLGIV
jgi:hypothetical protein